MIRQLYSFKFIHFGEICAEPYLVLGKNFVSNQGILILIFLDLKRRISKLSFHKFRELLYLKTKAHFSRPLGFEIKNTSCLNFSLKIFAMAGAVQLHIVCLDTIIVPDLASKNKNFLLDSWGSVCVFTRSTSNVPQQGQLFI